MKSLGNFLSYSLFALTCVQPVLANSGHSGMVSDGLINGLPVIDLDVKPDKCPPCFNCMLPAFSCKQFAKCNEFTGRCDCPPGFGGDDCASPVCGGLNEGLNRPVRNGTEECACEDGWDGINCNICTEDSSCDAFMPEGLKGTCYRGGILVEKNYQMCKVTNRKILDILNGKIPQVTFSCNATSADCNFQFWIDQSESFYCGLDTCQFETEFKGDTNITRYSCENAYCKCIPGRMLCGEAGSIDISDFLTETIRGPGDFQCDSKKGGCSFSEPSMNDLIKSVFGDPSITLACRSSECLHYTQLPGYVPPSQSLNKRLVIASLVGALLIIAGGIAAYRLLIQITQEKSGFIALPTEDDSSKLMAGHLPATLQFSDVSYNDNEKTIISGVMGTVSPGEIMAIMGGSGAGKTTLLDILAAKTKRGVVSGRITVNGHEVPKKDYKRVIGFVDQDDYLMPTLTVYETIVTSALLRLPKSMSTDAKKLRAIETMSELGILGIKDQLIGNEENRGISGGEKRRVAIACELVTSPSILFLDEPTSGLDAYNAFNVVESLIKLARNYNRTVVFTIHQPRSNIVSLFDKLVLLAKGRLVYSGKQSEAAQFFSELGYDCPPGFNVADFLIDLTMLATGSVPLDDNDDENVEDRFDGWLGTRSARNSVSTEPVPSAANPPDENLHSPIPRTDSLGIDSTSEWRHYASHRDEIIAPTPATQLSKPSIPSGFATATSNRPITLESLVESYESSALAGSLRNEIESSRSSEEESVDGNGSNHSSISLKGHSRIGFVGQFKILSVRTFKNLYRDPMLLLTHYIIATMLAMFCGFLYYNVANDISGFQNRLGLFFFLLALFGFSTLTTLNLFADERIIFLRERSNDYYRPISYYVAKVMFDIVPLRVFPPIILGLILYPLVGLTFDDGAFWKFLVILTLFNLTAAAICLLIGILIKNSGVANLVGSLFMLFSLLFAGLFLNHDSMPAGTVYLQYLSIFHYAYEALAVNEVRYLTLTERKFGLSIEVPGATILSTFGFDSGAVLFDIMGLFGFFITFLVAGYVAMHFILVEKR
ncbi:uncharacterized protein SAPINGB_P005913 [Magnusiomyces paraingens]|uniref:ABC transporter domain-containing protein n=1 Tax=Magnusiomyces paraingens TaxID=2606893 RepID=A0A5E8C4B6_9ASCO|nr:uncharacterized protein SAPINGB_P005913 [Saprochaete ingens]VVT57870.1 unnamed protein product [Saprochaete ingens]